MLAFDPASIENWLRAQPGRRGPGPGLGEDALPTVLLALARLAERLEAVRTNDLGRLGAVLSDPPAQATLREIAHHLSTGRRLRILSWIIETALPNASEILADLFDPAAKPVGSGAALRGDVQRHHRIALIETIFAPERRARVQAACERGRS